MIIKETPFCKKIVSISNFVLKERNAKWLVAKKRNKQIKKRRQNNAFDVIKEY